MPFLHSGLLGLVAAAFTLTAAVAADDYPNKPVRIIIPFAPGGINDIAARVVAAHLSERLGKQFIAENRTGAGGVVGTEIVANAPPDGYMLTVVSIANAVQPALYKLTFDPIKAFDAVAMFVTSPNTLAVHPGSAGKDGEGVGRARQGQARRHRVRLGRHRRLAPSRHGAVQDASPTPICCTCRSAAPAPP